MDSLLYMELKSVFASNSVFLQANYGFTLANEEMMVTVGATQMPSGRRGIMDTFSLLPE